MKTFKVILGLMFFALTLSGVQPLHAANDAEEQLKKIAEKKAELNNHEWEVSLSSPAAKGEVATDVLVFKGQQFESKSMTAKGYKPTNYTVSLQEGGPTVWETMQSTDKGEPVFWRGEWEGESMRGVMSKQVGEGKNEDYYFSSTSSKAITEEVPVPVEEVVEEVEEIVETEVPADTLEAVEDEVEEQEEAAEELVEEVQDKPKKKWF